jgi:predicted component of type VI protein secretion system
MSTEPLAAFLEACGATGPLRLSAEAPGQGTLCRELHQPFAVLGRSSQADLTLADAAVSKRHAYVQVVAGRVFCVDLQSRAGTLWDGERRRSGWLDGGRAVEVGPYTVRLQEGGGVDAPAAAADPLAGGAVEPDPLPGVTIEIRKGASGQSSWRMDRALALVGQAPGCKLRVLDHDVPRFYCSLVRTPAGLWAVGLVGVRGITVNGKQVPWARLDDGDELRVGGVRLAVRYDAPPRAEPAEVRPSLPVPAAAEAAPPLPLLPGKGPLPLPLPLSLPAEPAEAGALLLPLANHFAVMQQQMFDQFTQAMLMMGQMFTQLHREQVSLLRDELERVRQITQDVARLQAEVAKSRPAAPEPVAGPPTAAPAQPSAVPPAATGAAPKPAPAPPRPTPLPKGGPSAEDVHAVLFERIEALQQERQSRWQTILQLLSGKPSDKSMS